MRQVFSLILSLIVVSFLALSCSQMSDDKILSSSVIEQSQAVYPAEVTLVSVSKNYRPGYLWDTGVDHKVTIIVKNIAYTKKVNVYSKCGDGVWRLFPATYTKKANAAGTEEIWTAVFNVSYFVNEGGSITGYDSLKEFVLKYEVNGVTYWDNNNGKNYTVEKIGPRFTVIDVSESANYQGGSYLYAAVKNLAYSKKVTLVYSADGWKTTKTCAGTFYKSINAEQEVWKFDPVSIGYDPINPSTVEYAISYEPSGKGIFWDNNFGTNYKFQTNYKY